MTERAPFDKGRSGERTYNDEQDRYILPADHQEVERLDTQHKAVTMLFDGLLPPEMLRTISQSNHSTNAEVNVLDVGCGTGQWLIDLAREYPRIHGVGIDITMIHPPESEYPPNIRFIKRDILAPLPQEWLGRFDIVHARFLITGIKDFPALIRRLSTLLKSGGYLVILEPELKCRLTTSSRSSQDEGAEHSTAKTLEEVCPGIARYNKIALQAMQSFGMDMQATSKIPSYILESGSFEEQSVKTQCKELPMSDWSEDPRMKQIGECQLSNSLAYPDTIKRMVLASSIIDEVEFEIAKKGYQDDIRSGQGRPVLPIWCIWAKRK